MAIFSSDDYRIKTSSIIVARALYAMNWFDIAPALKNISADLHINFLIIGLVTTSFYIGLALFQLVGGALAHRIGSVRTSVIGLVILGTFAIVSGLSVNFVELAAARFMAGMGSALFFSPALGVISEISPEDRYGFHVSLYNGAFSFGAGIGIFAFGYADVIIGWRMSLIIGGLLLLLATFFMYVMLRNVKVRAKVSFRKMFSLFKNKLIWILPVATIGSAIAETIMGQFFVYYLEEYLKYSSVLASSVSSIYLFFGLPAGFISGYMMRRTAGRSYVFMYLFIMGITFFAVPFERSIVIIALTISMFSVFSIYGFSYLYTVASKINKETVSFSLSIVNFVQMIISSIVPYVYAFVQSIHGFEGSWIVMGIISTVAAFGIIAIKFNSGSSDKDIAAKNKI
ncbi:MAG: MFS transporter [Thermoplasmata archaeon]